MPDLHVVSLRFALRPSEGVSSTSPPPVELETNEALSPRRRRSVSALQTGGNMKRVQSYWRL
jgi:hypothetical protein